MTALNTVSGRSSGGSTNSPIARYDRSTGARLGARGTVDISVAKRPAVAVLSLGSRGEILLSRTTVIGRQPPAGSHDAVFVADPSPGLSRAHLQIDFDGWQARITDLGSRNGTWHRHSDGGWTQLAPTLAFPLDDGDCLWFAEITAAFNCL
ncbi:MAG: FHA domain-containing protein [Actinomycetia bacterium]|nr:FHA domain-containing protein [Actinomycetes bacterium]